MKRKLLIALVIAALLGGGGVYAYRKARLRAVPEAAWRCLRQSQQMTLYSIHPREAPTELVGAQLFHGYRIVGQVSVATASDQQHVTHAIKHAVLSHMDEAACFNPRHAVHVTDGQSEYDFVICYECGAMALFVGDKFVGKVGIGGSPDALNSILAAAKVPLSE